MCKTSLGPGGTWLPSLNINNTVTEEDNPALAGDASAKPLYGGADNKYSSQGKLYSDRLQLDLSYNTGARAMADRRSRVRLRYEGEQFDLVEGLEAGQCAYGEP